MSTRVRILELATDRVRVQPFLVDVKPSQHYGLLAVLEREVKARNLGKPEQFRIQAWDQRKGWVDHRPG